MNCAMAVLSFLLKMDFMVFHSFILHAVTISTPARAERGIIDITPPRTNMESSSTTAWITEVRRVSPPLFMATLVLAIAAVAGTPPKKGSRIFPTPCAISS